MNRITGKNCFSHKHETRAPNIGLFHSIYEAIKYMFFNVSRLGNMFTRLSTFLGYIVSMAHRP